MEVNLPEVLVASHTQPDDSNGPAAAGPNQMSHRAAHKNNHTKTRNNTLSHAWREEKCEKQVQVWDKFKDGVLLDWLNTRA